MFSFLFCFFFFSNDDTTLDCFVVTCFRDAKIVFEVDLKKTEKEGKVSEETWWYNNIYIYNVYLGRDQGRDFIGGRIFVSLSRKEGHFCYEIFFFFFYTQVCVCVCVCVIYIFHIHVKICVWAGNLKDRQWERGMKKHIWYQEGGSAMGRSFLFSCFEAAKMLNQERRNETNIFHF